MSAAFLQSPPDTIGYMGDNIFQVAVATYLGQPCTIIAPVVGRCFENSGVQVDKHGSNLAAASLPGQGHRDLHNQLQSLLQAIMKIGGIQSKKEAFNFLLNKVGDPHITLYVNHVSRRQGNRQARHAIIPDIHATNFPVGRQKVNDSSLTRDAEAIFEVKTLTTCI